MGNTHCTTEDKMDIIIFGIIWFFIMWPIMFIIQFIEELFDD